ncbi:protein CHAPERONE-LIKE PROTEIN OF POR1, chloroplastic [Cryptomeria japonica]|uniref:protein CHAPERONE-LIKE PROTEIN OF POR1, chloroplastic n=1 Tax=Cryptomeria japonica TaxID=3369 RepID=UPI0027DA005A|nr:protein CHAPERONE-LIKE PROTEIN OF POR1, chloroplastic [Cryptomeria japonica]
MAMVGCQSGLCNSQWNALNCTSRVEGVGACRRVWNRCNINNSVNFRKTKSRWSRVREGKYWGCSVKRVLQTHANSKADDSLPFEMSLESALKVLGVREGASFEEIMRAKNSILDSNRDNQELAAQVEAAYDTLLMKSLMQRRAGKVVDNSIRFADVKLLGNSGIGGMPEWLKNFLKNSPVSVEAPSTNDLGIQTGVYGALMAWTLVNGIQYSAGGQYSSGGADVPGLILATGFGASLYFLRKKNVKLGKAAVITVGGLVVGAVLGGVVESWLQVDVVPLFGISSPAVVVSEFVLLSQWLSSLYFR